MATIYKRNKYWWVSYKDRTGRRITQSTKLTDKTSANVIKKHYDTVEKSYCLTNTPLQHAIRLSDWYAEYIRLREPRHPKSTIKNDRLAYKSLITFLNTDKYLNDIKEGDLENWYNHLLKTSATATANCRFRHLKTLFNTAVKKNYLIKSPCEQIATVKETTNKIRVLSQDEIKLLFDSMAESFKQYVRVGLYTGCRVSEICRLKKQDIDLERHTITVTSNQLNPTKSKKFRVIPIPDHSIDFFKRLLESNRTPYLLVNNQNNQCKPDWITRQFSKYANQAAIDCTYHDLRRTYGAWLIMGGADIITVQENLGHSDISVTRKHYLHLTIDHKKEQVNKLPEIL